MLALVHRSPFRRVFLVFVLVLSGAISAVRAAAPTPRPRLRPRPGSSTPLSSPRLGQTTQ
jgi:hypothetical protein